MADILEIFELFQEEKLVQRKNVVYAGIALYTLAMYQFSFVPQMARNSEVDKPKSEKKLFNQLNSLTRPRKTNNKVFPIETNAKPWNCDEYISDVKKSLRDRTKTKRRGKGRRIDPGHQRTQNYLRKFENNVASESTATTWKCRELHEEVFPLLVSLLMLDLPFFVLRVYVIIGEDIHTEMHMFFTCKNFLVMLLLIYRLLVLSCTGVDEEVDWSRESANVRRRNVQNAIV